MPSRENIFKAADDLAAEGKRVSTRAVREALGGGSFRDVCRHLSRWREERDARTRKAAAGEAEAAARDLTPDTERIMLGFLESAWREALAQAQRQFEEERRSLAERADALQWMLDEALERAETAEEAYEALAAAVGEHMDTLPKRFTRAETKEQTEIWGRVRALAAEIAARNGGTFTTNEVAAAIPVEIAQRLEEMGVLAMTPQRIAGRFRLRAWFECVKGNTFRLPIRQVG